jgi:hypothetical protein
MIAKVDMRRKNHELYDVKANLQGYRLGKSFRIKISEPFQHKFMPKEKVLISKMQKQI